jgi:hypothetical protein
MTIDERSRHQLFARLEEVLGSDEATTLMEHLPPLGWADVATKRDLDQFAVATKRDLDQFAVATKRDLDQFAVATKRDLDQVAVATKRDLDQLALITKHELDQLRLDLDRVEQRVTATFRGELVAQTRTIIFALLGTVIAMGGVTIAAVRLA